MSSPIVCGSCGHDTFTPDQRCATCGTPTRSEVATMAPAADVSAFATEIRTLVSGATRVREGEPDPAVVLPIAIGRVVANRYRISRLIGVGGMGVVYRAWDDKLELEVALKVILP